MQASEHLLALSESHPALSREGRSAAQGSSAVLCPLPAPRAHLCSCAGSAEEGLSCSAALALSPPHPPQQPCCPASAECLPVSLQHAAAQFCNQLHHSNSPRFF